MNNLSLNKIKVRIFFVFILTFLYFSLPKIDLFYPFPAIPTGVRMADILALFMFLYLTIYRSKIGMKFNNRPLFFMSLLSLWLVHLFFSSYGGGVLKSIIGSIRLLEYVVVGYFVYFTMDTARLALLSSLVVHIVFSIFQFLLWFPNLNPGRGNIYSHEFSGLLGTPSDLSFFVGLVFLIVFKGGYKIALMYIITLINGVKSAVLFFPILLFSNRIKLLLPFGLLFSSVLLMYFFSDMKIFVEEIINAAGKGLNFEEIKYYTKLDITETTLGARVGKWGGALGIWLSQWNYFLFGYGGYSAGAAMDGGVVRLLFEYGVLGLVVITRLFTHARFLFFLVFMACNLFIDGYMSSVISPLLVVFFLINRKNYA